MFRSWGEFNSCATEVFHLFAEPARAVESHANLPTHTTHSQHAAIAPAVGLSLAGVECAYYVLFGQYPSDALVSDCFAPPRLPTNSALVSNSDTTAASSFALSCQGKNKKSATALKAAKRYRHRMPNSAFVFLDAFLRFVSVCAEEEGAGFVATPHASGSSPVAKSTALDSRGYLQFASASPSSFTPSLSSDVTKTVELQCWRQFESVAGPKGYLTLEDMSTVDGQHPFYEVHAVLEGPKPIRGLDEKTAQLAAQSDVARNRQRALTQHAFWIMDRDHDGKVCFDDARPYLLGHQ